MRSEPQEDEPSINIVMQSGIATSEHKGKHPKECGWVCKATEMEVGFNSCKEK